MKSIRRFWDRVESLILPVRLTMLLTVPAALLAIEGRSFPFFALVMLTNSLGVLVGVILFRFRLEKQVSPLLLNIASAPVRGRAHLRRAA
jgi:hypothetical protein